MHPAENINSDLQTIPDKAALLATAPQNLTAIQDFTLFNQYGRIRFLDPVDLNTIDLASLAVEYGNFTVRDFKRFQVQLHGILGTEQELRAQCASRGMRFVYYDAMQRILIMEK